MRKLIIGLGNPRIRYAGTRHNVGQDLIRYIVSDLGLKWQSKKHLASSVAVTEKWGSEICFAFPETYMNLSGVSVEKLIRYFGVEIKSDLLIIFDDVALPFGRLRLRSKGSDGGHNGIRSVHETIQTQHFARLRVGIDSSERSGVLLEDFVLKAFTADETKELGHVFECGMKACRVWAQQPIDKAMNAVNSVCAWS